MPQYKCPECGVILRRETPIPEGKKVKCPKCSTVFAAQAMAEKPAKPKDEDDDEGGNYTVADEPVEKDADKKKKVNYDSLRKKYPKSKRGPAMALVVQPSNQLLLVTIIMGVLCLLTLVYGIFPFLFAEANPVGDQKRLHLTLIFGSIAGFGVAGCMAYGASHFQSLTSKPWSIAAGVLTLVFCFLPTVYLAGKVLATKAANMPEDEGILGMLYWIATGIVGMFSLLALNAGRKVLQAVFNEEVKAGFEETAEKGINA